ncbi:c-type cytochrome [Piscinibacter gummiphilus]|uniref:Uncharacterized protein n=1 Tax=Piscinibacter gummiphilus TaxID=946333 RepID=A0A1W6LA42_9BURK|nr:c-type cytochrome [Piscinibacter gummiphilus]ARN21096.1 hypothetical protein A4W93_14995 [Piscinibacter gummiphilus]ATU65774.1 cytochrome C [Piscinibacter gummiphilus]GLS93645.1 hypothetical protein GCM10007918_09360 [Piscinibacter gummiphilus]
MRFVHLVLLAAAAPALAAPPNPLRGDPAAIEPGRAAYAAHCAACHGDQAVSPMAEAPDLRRLDGFCRRLADAALKSHCLRDVDTYYLRSVLDGKVRAGVVHMPPWRGVLRDDEIWAIRTFVETRPLDPPKRTTSVDAARAAAPPH